MPGAPPLPPEVEHPFEVGQGRITNELAKTIENTKRDGIRVSERAHGSQRAGSIQYASTVETIEVPVGANPHVTYQRVPLRFELLLNCNLSLESRYATLVHELGHLYCGHLGTPNNKWWPDRQGLPLEIREFEAESVCYLTPPISLDAVLKSSWLIEKMGRERLGPRKDKSTVAADN